MYLKEIKISGFKSFADKTNITLDDKITCIVGPNGSGKSNIIDAVKWVLGEQSVKSLRGTNNMSDVIFAGSKSRSPLNLASVSLVFDNSDSYLKVPYTEISVTRKVFRSGENEYYLNNEKCRLKDIYDLFLDSGMGKYAFNIISQGEVSKIISDSPLERRTIFEEAAGVLKYKRRKEEALKKLDKTNENLTRVKDIIKELEEQIEPLKIQSEKANKYLKIKENLEQIEIALIANDLEKLNVLYHEQTKQIEDLTNEIIEKTTSITNDDIELENKKQELEKINENLTSLQQNLLLLTKEEEKLNGEKNIIKERSKYDAEDVKVHENITNLKEQKLSLNNKLLSIKTDLTILDNKIKDNIKESSNKNNEYVSLNNTKEEIKNKISSLENSISQTEYKIKYLNDYIENSSFPISVKRLLNNPKLKGIHNTISKLIDVEEKYALSLEVALGGAKDYVVVDNPNIAKACINYLKENNLGRVTFFPLDVIKPRFIDNETLNELKTKEGFINVLANLVSYDEMYKNIVFNQLGNVLVINNIDNANIISKVINNKYKIVTLDGEIINVGGSITGGTIKKKSIISEKYELENLLTKKELGEKEILSLKEKQEIILKDIKEKETTLYEIGKEKVLLTEEYNAKHENYNNLKDTLDRVTLELNNLEDLEDNSIKSEEEKILEKYYEVLKEKELVNKKLLLLTDDKEKVSSLIEEYQAKYRLNNSNIRNLEEKKKTLEIDSSKMSVKMDNLLTILSETYQMTFEKAKANYVLEEDIDVARKNVNIYKKELKEIGIVNLGAIEEYERVSKRYDFLTKQNNDLEEAITTLLKIINELDNVMEKEFIKTFKEIEIEFNNVFKELFGGGYAKLKLTDESNILETGVNIEVSPPGKKITSISLLSGGEKTLTAISLLFAVLNIKKIPFCLFDEVEAALDEANVDRVGAYFSKYIGKTQLIIITHKKKTMEYANTLYGITMQESGVSKLVSVKLVD
ncbi:MAG: AAA family ATPase [Bacilli bacterium]|nr:AAA family ATPase [Mycoplasmatota bacterium]MDY4236794.1 AAA family ATPase [Bacilli bacterium]